MPFPRDVIFEACRLLAQSIMVRHQYEDSYANADFDELVLGWHLDILDKGKGGILSRALDLFRLLRDRPELEADGRPLSDLIVEEAAKRSEFAADESFALALARAGYMIEDRRLRPTLPQELDLPAADDEVHELLKRHNLTTPLGHLDQAIQNHGQRQWASANSQCRVFLESLLDEAAYRLVPNAPHGQLEGEARREALAGLVPPFLLVALNEWGNQGKNLVNGVFKRLHPQGSHPGLSDEEDSTFRLHLVLLLGRLFLRRLAQRP